MTVGIVISALAVAIAVVGVWIVYQRKLADLDPHRGRSPSASGVRLTAERLRLLSQPPWRVVYEIAEGRLGPIDHVVVGPSGPIAIETVLADRPDTDPDDGPDAVARAAIARGDLDDLTRRVGVSSTLLARVYWGSPRPDEPAASAEAGGQVHVEGQRLVDWLESRTGTLTSTEVDLVWQAVVVGIGRPDPLA